jgi:hypothetical protein
VPPDEAARSLKDLTVSNLELDVESLADDLLDKAVAAGVPAAVGTDRITYGKGAAVRCV